MHRPEISGYYAPNKNVFVSNFDGDARAIRPSGLKAAVTTRVAPLP